MTDILSPLLVPDQLDDLGRAILTLTSELWVISDRQILMEAALADRGISLDLDLYQPSEAVAAKLDEERKRLIASLIGTLTARD